MCRSPRRLTPDGTYFHSPARRESFEVELLDTEDADDTENEESVAETVRSQTFIIRRLTSHNLDFEKAIFRELRAIRVPIAQIQNAPARETEAKVAFSRPR